MAIRDWILKTWQNGIDVLNATNLQRIEDKIYELDNYAVPTILFCSSALVKNNSVTFGDIPGLEYTVLANSGIYIFDVHINVYNASSSTPDCKVTWNRSSTDYTELSIRQCCGGEPDLYNATTYTAKRASCHQMTTEVTYAVSNNGVHTAIHEHCVIEAGSTDVTFKLQGAQYSAHASDTVFTDNSHLIIKRAV